MEAICTIAVLLALGGLAALIGKSISAMARRYGELPAPALHFRLFILPVIATLPLLLVIHRMASFDWGGYFPLYQLLYLLGLPLILLGQPVTELLENTLSFHLSSLDLWVLDSLLVLQWILWGQILAMIIRISRQSDPSSGKADRIVMMISQPYQKITSRYGKKQVEGIIVLVVGLLFICLVCRLVIVTLHQNP
jgi:hypothetical protein